MGSKNKTRSRMKIVGATITAIFSLASVFSATYAWFAANNTVTASGMSISANGPDNIDFHLYYLHHFGSGQTQKDGNLNTAFNIYSGYYSNASNPSFAYVNPADSSINPTNIEQLWPAHQLTYALVVTTGKFHSFVLNDWAETRNDNTNKISASVDVSLSWAINIYGAAFEFSTKDENEQDIAEIDIVNSGFASYTDPNLTLTDVFDYAPITESHTANPFMPVSVASNDSISEQTSGTVFVIYFSILFDNSSSTFYSYNEADHFYYQDNNGDSNCYKGLSISRLSFVLS